MSSQEQLDYIKYLEDEVIRLTSLLRVNLKKDLAPKLNPYRRLNLLSREPPGIL